MNVTRNVILDLLPVYLSDEASPDTRRLVDEFLANDAELAAAARRAGSHPVTASPPVDLRADHQMRTLDRVKRLSRRRGILLGLALFLSLLPLSFAFDENGVRWLWAGRPGAVVLIVLCAAAAWSAYLWLVRRLNAAGL
jgi:hypothetical protein